MRATASGMAALAGELGRFRLREGGFVWTPDRALLGKLLSLTTEAAVVRIVHSSAQHEVRHYDPTQLTRAFLSPQTRIYVRDPEHDRWAAGRIVGYDLIHDEAGISYEIQLPGRDETVLLAEREFEARCFAPTVDPTEVLATGGAESQFFRDQRARVLRAVLEQRDASSGVSGLISASVDLHPHQFQVVRRVLDDPVQRYLLADEVGLGKTIEAGAIARQLVTELPSARIALLAPRSLLWQWERELRAKFDLVADGEQLTVFGHDDLAECAASCADFDLLIVDEAHHLAGRGGIAAESFPLLAAAAHGVDRLLLLTATPVLSDERATLGLLHLLDPTTYPVDDLDAFRSRLQRRQEFGELSLALDAGVSPVLLRSPIARLQELLPDDGEVARLGAASIDRNIGEETRHQAVVALRQYLSDNYRLEHRLLRTRRADVRGAGRDCRVTLEFDEDSRTRDLVALLEDWRISAGEASTARTEDTVAAVYEALFVALGAGVGEFASELDRRAEALGTGAGTAFADEPRWIELCRSRLAAGGEGMTRLELCVASVDLAIRGHVGDEPARFVAFSSSTEMAREVQAGLQSRRVTTVVAVTADMDAEDIEDEVDRFLASDWPAVLVSDRTGEEGLNLQAADGLLYLDLPLDPERLEQRIGRLDRLGRTLPDVKTRVVMPNDDQDSPWLAWHELLADGFGLYSRSISDVQFLLDDLRNRVRLAMFRRGATGLAELTEEVRQVLAAERRRLDQQYALDQLDRESTEAQETWGALERAEARERLFGDDLDPWIYGVLGFGRSDVDAERYRIHWRRKTRIPERPGWRERFEEALGRPLTYRRAAALANPDTRLVRPGFALTDEVLRLMRRDDRGTAFATWRTDARWPQERGDWLAFQLTYIIELDEEQLRGTVERSNADLPFEFMRRLAGGVFPPWIETRYVDGERISVTDPLSLDILRRDYDRRSDLNLAARPDLIGSLVGESRFAELCRAARVQSEQLLRTEAGFAARLERERERALQRIAERSGRIERRRAALARLGEADHSLDQQQHIASALRTAAERPSLRLEAIGAFIVSRQRAPAAS